MDPFHLSRNVYCKILVTGAVNGNSGSNTFNLDQTRGRTLQNVRFSRNMGNDGRGATNKIEEMVETRTGKVYDATLVRRVEEDLRCYGANAIGSRGVAAI